MNLLNIFIGTGILWLLTALAVVPLAQHFLERKLKCSGISCSNEQDMDEATKAKVNSIATRCFILADVLVLGLAGMIIGLVFNYYFIGIALDTKGWPGMIVFIVSSLIGSTLGYHGA